MLPRRTAATDPEPGLGDQGRRAFHPFGTPGGNIQTQAMLQVLLNHFVFGQDMQRRSRARALPATALHHLRAVQYLPGRLALEARISEPVIAELARRGHEIQRWPDWIWTAGAVCAIDVDESAV